MDPANLIFQARIAFVVGSCVLSDCSHQHCQVQVSRKRCPVRWMYIEKPRFGKSHRTTVMQATAKNQSDYQ